VEFDAGGNLLIVETGGSRIRKVNAAGVISTVAGHLKPADRAVTSVSAASFSGAALAPEAIAAAFGTAFASETRVADSTPLPTKLAGASVKVRDSAGIEWLAPLFFVSPTQINFQIPAGAKSGPATVTVMDANGGAAAGVVMISPVAPGLFSANANGQLSYKIEGKRVSALLQYARQVQPSLILRSFAFDPLFINFVSDSIPQISR
jgi:hypothetical protein